MKEIVQIFKELKEIFHEIKRKDDITGYGDPLKLAYGGVDNALGLFITFSVIYLFTILILVIFSSTLPILVYPATIMSIAYPPVTAIVMRRNYFKQKKIMEEKEKQAKEEHEEKEQGAKQNDKAS